MLLYDLLDLFWLWHISFLIVMHKVDLLMFYVQSFCWFKNSSVIFGIFYFFYEVSCSIFSGISNFWFIYLSISFLDFLNCLFFSGYFQFSVCRLMSFCPFNILSRSVSDIWWLFTSSCIRNEFLPHIWLCPWAFPICSLAVLLRMRYSQFLLSFALYIFPGSLHFV